MSKTKIPYNYRKVRGNFAGQILGRSSLSMLAARKPSAPGSFLELDLIYPSRFLTVYSDRMPCLTDERMGNIAFCRRWVMTLPLRLMGDSELIFKH